MLELLEHKRKRRPLIDVRVPRLFHYLVNFGHAALGCLHSVAFLDVLNNVGQRLQRERRIRA